MVEAKVTPDSNSLDLIFPKLFISKTNFTFGSRQPEKWSWKSPNQIYNRNRPQEVNKIFTTNNKRTRKLTQSKQQHKSQDKRKPEVQHASSQIMQLSNFWLPKTSKTQGFRFFRQIWEKSINSKMIMLHNCSENPAINAMTKTSKTV